MHETRHSLSSVSLSLSAPKIWAVEPQLSLSTACVLLSKSRNVSFVHGALSQFSQRTLFSRVVQGKEVSLSCFCGD